MWHIDDGLPDEWCHCPKCFPEMTKEEREKADKEWEDYKRVSENIRLVFMLVFLIWIMYLIVFVGG